MCHRVRSSGQASTSAGGWAEPAYRRSLRQHRPPSRSEEEPSAGHGCDSLHVLWAWLSQPARPIVMVVTACTSYRGDCRSHAISGVPGTAAPVTSGAAGPQGHGEQAASIVSRRARSPAPMGDLDNTAPGYPGGTPSASSSAEEHAGIWESRSGPPDGRPGPRDYPPSGQRMGCWDGGQRMGHWGRGAIPISPRTRRLMDSTWWRSSCSSREVRCWWRRTISPPMRTVLTEWPVEP